MRQDVKRIAAQAATLAENKLDLETLYHFFMEVCKAEKIRPRELNIRKDGNWILASNNSKISIEPIHFPDPVMDRWTGPDYEEMILARQEAYMD